MQPEVEQRGPEDIRDGHQLEVVGSVGPELGSGLYVCAQASMAFGLDLGGGFVLQVFHCAGGEFFPGLGAGGPGEFLFEQGKQSLHPARDGFLRRQQARHGTLKQPAGEVDVSRRQEIAGGLLGKKADAEALCAVTFNMGNAGAAIGQKPRNVFDGHPVHVAEIEKHHSFAANGLVEQIECGKIVAIGAKRVSRWLLEQDAAPTSGLAFHQGRRGT